MEKMVGYCGYNCHLCAARSDDPEVRQKLVDGWRKIYGHEHYTVENVHCVGCRAEGHHADLECKARPCAVERGVDSCAACDDFPCDNITAFETDGHGHHRQAIQRLRAMREGA